MKRIVLGSMVLAAGCLLADDVVVRDGEREWRFAEVNGTSRLPLEFMCTGENESELTDVTLPRYWIAKEMVTEGDFARVMGRKVREGRDADKPVRNIEWAEALEFCERFTKKYREQFPTNSIASMPSMIEWAHAVRVLDDRVDLCGEVGTFLFTSSAFGGYLHTLWRDAKPLSDVVTANENLAWHLAVVQKRVRMERVGLRMVIIDVTQEMLDDHPIVMRGSIALQHGHINEARRYLELAKKHGSLSSNQLARVNHALEYANALHEEDFEDWSGLVAVSSAFAEKRGYLVEPFSFRWMTRGWMEMEDKTIAAEYEKRGMAGRFVRIGDLPPEMRKNQSEGGSHPVIFLDNEQQVVDIPITSNTLVQVMDCDFSGDGRKDMVVEAYGSVGSDGYWYNFYQQLPNGAYTNVLGLQTVGLCAFPKKDGGACGFLCVDKNSNPVLSVRLLTLEGGVASYCEAHERSFYMLDADEGHVYVSAPFIGAGYGLGWRHLEGSGVWYRPLYWPWKQGEVQGYEEAVKQVEKAAAKAKKDNNDYAELVHIVKEGDTLWGIAKAHCLDFEQLCKSNGKLQDWNLIRPGEEIVLGELLDESGDVSLFAYKTESDREYVLKKFVDGEVTGRNSLFMRRRTAAGTSEWQLIMTSDDKNSDFDVMKAKLSKDGRFVWMVCNPHIGTYNDICSIELATQEFRILMDGDSVEEQPDGTLFVKGKKTYLSDENGEPLGAAWYDLWMTREGKIVRKTKPVTAAELQEEWAAEQEKEKAK